jgi:streptomycin 3"-adenylyltransferase
VVCGWDDCPPEVRAQVAGFSAALQAALSADLAALYLHGSLALGAFNPARSDIDLLAVCARRPPARALRRAAAAIVFWAARPRPFEISLVAAGDLHPWQHPTPYIYHFSEDWRERATAQLADWPGEWPAALPLDGDLAAHVAVTRARGVALAGPPPAEVLPPVPRADFLDSLRADFAWGRAALRQYPAYFVLNACRILAFAAEGHLFSKLEGAAWAAPRLPAAHAALVAAAVAHDQAPSPVAPLAVDPGSLEAFAAHMDRAIAAAVADGMPHA